MVRTLFQIVGLVLLSGSSLAFGQLDSSSTILLRPTGVQKSAQSLDSNRYKVRAPESRPQRPTFDDDPEIDETPGAEIPAAITPPPPKKTESKPKEVAAQPAPKPIEPTATTEPIQVNQTQPPENKTQTSAPVGVPLTEQMKELLLGGTDKEIEDYQKRIHPQDPRQNVVNISFSPAYYYNDSDSRYSFRRYNSNGPGLGLGMNVWMTPFFGMQSKFFTSVSASQRNGESMVSTEVQAFEAGVRFRKHFGYSRKAAQLSWGIDYHDSQNKISKSSTSSIGRKSTGVSLSLEAELPKSVTYSTTMGVAIRPRMQHKEHNTGIEAQSGSKGETNAINMSLGGQWLLDRQNQLFWRGEYSVERNLFEGSASVADPTNDATPEGVSVTNTMMIFYFGFRWGS